MADRDVLINENTMIAIANAIRNKSNSQASYTPAQMPAAINQISGGSSEESKPCWTRPTEWPNLDAMDLSSDCIYITYYTGITERAFLYYTVKSSAGCALDIGTITDGTFTVLATESIGANVSICRDLSGYAYDYVVVRIAPLNSGRITYFTTYNLAMKQNSIRYHSNYQHAVEIYANVPNATSFYPRQLDSCEHIKLLNYSPTSFANSFYSMISLKLIEGTGWDVSSSTNCNAVFYACNTLIKVDVDSLDMDSATSINSFFVDCRCLKTITGIENINTGSCKDFSSFFRNCLSLDEVDVSSWDTSNATNMAQMFSGCCSLKTLDLSKWDTSSVTKFNDMFNNCINLQTINNNHLVTNLATTVSSMFYYCRSMVLDISGCDFSGITAVGSSAGSFREISNRVITVPATLTYIGNYAFYEAVCYEYHMLATAPPVLYNANVFSADSNRLIYVPYSADHSILAAYKAAEYWSSKADYIVEELA